MPIVNYFKYQFETNDEDLNSENYVNSRGPYFGYFECSYNHRWQSARAWREYGQQCKQCNDGEFYLPKKTNLKTAYIFLTYKCYDCNISFQDSAYLMKTDTFIIDREEFDERVDHYYSNGYPGTSYFQNDDWEWYFLSLDEENQKENCHFFGECIIECSSCQNQLFPEIMDNHKLEDTPHLSELCEKCQRTGNCIGYSNANNNFYDDYYD